MKNFKTTTNRFQKADKFGQIEEDSFSVGFGVVDMSTQAFDYNISSTGVLADYMPEYMFVIPESSGIS